jgi:hypothetical protein
MAGIMGTKAFLTLRLLSKFSKLIPNCRSPTSESLKYGKRIVLKSKKHGVLNDNSVFSLMIIVSREFKDLLS